MVLRLKLFLIAYQKRNEKQHKNNSECDNNKKREIKKMTPPFLSYSHSLNDVI